MTRFCFQSSVYLTVLNYLGGAAVSFVTHFPFIFVVLSLIAVCFMVLFAGKPIR
jgi:hypothetical protein